MPTNDSELRLLFEAAVSDFQSDARSVADVFGLVRHDTPEWPRYLKTLRAAARQAAVLDREELRLCDLGGYFGIIAASMNGLGYRGDVVDSYGVLLTDAKHADLRRWWAKVGLAVHDIDLQQPDLRLPFEDESFHLVTLLAVIEHFPNTPRLVLEEARRILRPDGLLIVDTPNAGALGTRVGFLLHGEGVWASASEVYDSEIPFPGHTRCYSRSELVDVLKWSGFEPVDVALFDLGPHGATSLAGRTLYGRIYPLLARGLPDVRGYIWVSARRSTTSP